MSEFKQISEQWLKYKARFVKRSTLAQYRRVLFKQLVPLYEQYKNFHTVHEELSTRYKPKTVRDAVIVLNQVLEYACKNDFPLTDQRIPSKTVRLYQNRIKVLSVYEQKIFSSYLLEEMDFSKLGIFVCLYTGLRLGEICALQVKDVDFRAKVLRISKTVQRICDGSGESYHHIDTPKTACSEREIPLPEFLLVLLAEQLRNLPSEYYVASGTSEFVQPRTYQSRLQTYYRQCDFSSYHFHTLRHTFASRAIELGFDPKSLSEILGHANVRITLNLYVHPSLEKKRTEMELFSAIV